MESLNARHPWSHNDHFHGWIVRHLPERRALALDVGCGEGALLDVLALHVDQASCAP
jgi:2-polyprenyl-3-methyl-5-hydroxy-6-metoxy-1,4-benzoquinol methylase